MRSRLAEQVRQAAVPLTGTGTGTGTDYDPLLRLTERARFVLLGEASHGTHEIYRERAEITKRLIVEQEIAAVVVEADWPDAHRVNCYVRGASDDANPAEALSGFKRFPSWMWRNTAVTEFVEWLRAHNDALPPGAPRVGFYGMDLYSLFGSITAVLGVLDRLDPEAAQRARRRYACFEQFGDDAQAYGYLASLGMQQDCERSALDEVLDLQRLAADNARQDGRVAEDDLFYAEQNARLVKNAEQYYRVMFEGRPSSWNLRDRHMVETIEALAARFDRQIGRSKLAVWAHNSHLGDARATEMSRRGELNVGQLIREHHGHEAALIGFTTHSGTVTAASDWDKPAERKRVRPSLPGSYEALFHEAGVPRFFLDLQGESDLMDDLREPRLERAIGVIYRPDTERLSHYFLARLPNQFDGVIHLDETRAVEPLEAMAGWHAGEPAETFPFGV